MSIAQLPLDLSFVRYKTLPFTSRCFYWPKIDFVVIHACAIGNDIINYAEKLVSMTFHSYMCIKEQYTTKSKQAVSILTNKLDLHFTVYKRYSIVITFVSS